MLITLKHSHTPSPTTPYRRLRQRDFYENTSPHTVVYNGRHTTPLPPHVSCRRCCPSSHFNPPQPTNPSLLPFSYHHLSPTQPLTHYRPHSSSSPPPTPPPTTVQRSAVIDSIHI